MTHSVVRGAGALHRLLRGHTHDLRLLDVAGFREWLARHTARWEAEPVFVQRAAIREIRRAHPGLAALERECRRAAAAAGYGPGAGRWAEVAHALEGARKAVAGLGAAMTGADASRRDELGRRRDGKVGEVERLERERAELLRASPERRELLRVSEALDRLRDAGLTAAEARLRELQRARGQGAGRGGTSFEDVALAATRRCLVPELEGRRRPGAGLRVLRGVTLGAARTELDGLVVRPSSGDGPVEVLAVVEAKRNPNDLAHGFRQRQADLAWLTGDSARYDPADWRTRGFPAGHFDRAAVHEEDGERFVLDRTSFARFHRDAATGHFLHGVCLVTRRGTLWGVSGAALGRIAHRVATDLAWDPGDDAYLAHLLAWARSLAGELEAPEVVRLYAAERGRARQLLLVGR